MAKEDHKPSKPELADHGIYPDRFVEVSRNYLCFSNSNGGRVTQRTTEYAKPEGRAARSLNEVAPENGHQSALRLAVIETGREPAGPQRYRVGTETPRFRATSRGATPLTSSFRADFSVLSVIFRLRPLFAPVDGRLLGLL